MGELLDDFFGKDYFDGGTDGVGGQMAQYLLEDYVLEYRYLIKTIKDTFFPESALDIGCAKGFLVMAFLEQGIDAYGLDISEYAIGASPESVRQRLGVHDAGTEPLPFPDDSFDFVTILGVIEYLKDHELAISEIRRVLRPGGRVYLTTVFKRERGDPYRFNIHTAAFWKAAFARYGLAYDKDAVKVLLKTRVRYFQDAFRMDHTSVKKDGLRFKVGRPLMCHGGPLGRWAAYAYYRWFYRFVTGYGNMVFRTME